MADTHRQFKDRLYGQLARLGKALASPHRLEMLELLAQSERTVDSLATEMTSEPIVLGDHDADGDLDVLRAYHWYRGLVTQATSDIELTTDEGEELSVVKLAR